MLKAGRGSKHHGSRIRMDLHEMEHWNIRMQLSKGKYKVMFVKKQKYSVDSLVKFHSSVESGLSIMWPVCDPLFYEKECQ